MIKLKSLVIFVTLVETKSFSKTAKRLNLSVPAISQQILALEADLKSQLFVRTTRTLNITEVGRLYYDYSKRIVAGVHEIEGLASSLHEEPSGKLRAFVIRYFAEKFVIPFLPEFTKLYPKIRIELEIGERVPDLMGEEVDVALGISLTGLENWIQVTVAETRYVFCASPAYLKTYGTPRTLTDLGKHKYIAHQARTTEKQGLIGPDEFQVVPHMLINDSRAMLNCCMDGLGIVKLPKYLVNEALEKRKVVEVLENFVGPKLPVYAFYQSSSFLQPKIRKFIDYFQTRIRQSGID